MLDDAGHILAKCTKQLLQKFRMVSATFAHQSASWFVFLRGSSSASAVEQIIYSRICQRFFE